MPGKVDRSSPPRGEPVRQRILDAAERLLRDGRPAFSMRDLAGAAGVSFATPFNQFGSKAAIMHALSGRLIDAMVARFNAVSPPRDIVARVLLAVDIAVAVMLEEPEVNRAVMGWIGTPANPPGTAFARSAAFWSMALGEAADAAAGAEPSLPHRLAFAFRGILSFWTAGELPDEALQSCARTMAHELVGSAGLVSR